MEKIEIKRSKIFFLPQSGFELLTYVKILMVAKSATDVGGKLFQKCHRKVEPSLVSDSKRNSLLCDFNNIR